MEKRLKVNTNFRVMPDFLEVITDKAKELDMNRNELIEKAVREFLEKQEKEQASERRAKLG